MRWTISRKLGVSYIVLIGLLILAGTAGIMANRILGNALDFATGPAWNAADGAMESVINIQKEIIELEKLLYNIRSNHGGHYELKTNGANESIGRMLSSNLFKKELINDLNSKLAAYNKQREALVDLYNRSSSGSVSKSEVDELAASFYASIKRLLTFLEQMEEVADSMVGNAMDENSTAKATALHTILWSIFIGIATALIAFWVNIKTIVAPLKDAADALEDISKGEGNLNRKLPQQGDDEIGQLSQAFNTFTDKIRNTVVKVRDHINPLDEAASDLLSITEQTQKGVSAQQSETRHVATAITEMTASVHEVARNASHASQQAESANSEASQGKEVVHNTANVIQHLATEVNTVASVLDNLNGKTQEIGKVLDVIKAIAEQTNLLALNAAIEAARAGEQGRGFAVVADEVRTLASRTQESTTEIHNMIESLQSASNQAVEVMRRGADQTTEAVNYSTQASEALDVIAASISSIADTNVQIASAAEEQSSVSEEINRNVVNINTISEDTNQRSKNVAGASDRLAYLASELKNIVSQFRID